MEKNMSLELIFELLSDQKVFYLFLALGLLFLGIILLILGVGGEIKLWKFQILSKELKGRRWTTLCLSILLLLTGGYLFWHLSRVPSIMVYTEMASEEYKVFEEVSEEFEESHRVNVKIENTIWKNLYQKIKQNSGKVDLITFDINRPRREIVDKGLIEELRDDEFKRLLPSSVNPSLLEHLMIDGKRYFMPFRPNVQVVFYNKEKLKGKDIPETWKDVKKIAKRLKNKEKEERILIQLHSDMIDMTLYQLIRSAGGDPYNLKNDNTKKALRFMRDLYPYIAHKSPKANWQTASGFLLTNSVYLMRNWCFSYSIINASGRREEFKAYSGWKWNSDEDSRPFNILGGEFMAIPKGSSHKELAKEYMRFLMSQEVQKKFAEKLSWPGIRLDIIGETEEWQKQQQETIHEALLYAEPLPDNWFPHMPVIYREMFNRIISLDDNMSSDDTLAYYQKKINAVTTTEYKP
jgi:trehalose transport system substrate-binding protein